MSKKILFVTLLILLIAGVFYYGISKSKKVEQENMAVKTPQNSEIRLIFSRDIEDAAFLADIARDKGFYKKNNVEVTDILVQGNFTNILLADGGDVVFGTYYGSLSAYFNNAETRVLANVFKPFVHFGVSRFPRGQEESIKKVLLRQITGDPLIVAKEAVKKLGVVDPDSVEITAIPSTKTRLEMLKRGDADFTIFSNRADIAAVEDMKIFTVYQSEEIVTEMTTMRQIGTTQDVINKKSEALNKFVNAIDETLNYIDSNQDEVVAYLQDKYTMSLPQAERFYQLYSNSRKDVPFVPSIETSTEVAQNVKKIMEITSEKDLFGYVYDKFAQNAEAVRQ